VAEIVRINGRPVVDYMARDYESLLQALHDAVPAKLPEWQDFTNNADFGNVLLQLFAHVGDIISYYQDRVANESFLGTARTRRSVIEHLRLIGYRLGTAVPAAASLTVTVPAAVNAVVTINAGDAFATKSRKDQPSVRFEYVGEAALTIDFSTIAADPATGRKIYAGVPVEEGRLIKAEVIGVSDGSPDQHFVLARSPAILRPIGADQQASRDITLLSRLGDTVDAWTLQETLAFSRAGQKDFVVEIDDADRATIIFGDGNFGAIPPSGAQLLATYRVGGGTVGNVAARTIQTIVGAPQLALLGAQVTNPAAATGGADRESVDHAVRHAPAVFRSLKRAVTGGDYEALTRSFKGVAKVRARPTGWNTVTLFVAPEGGGKVSDVLEVGLRTFFEDKRMVSQIIEIADVDYVPIFVTIEIGVASYYVRSDVQANVEQAAAGLLAFDNVDFGQTIYLSKFYEVGEAVPGIIYVNITEFRRTQANPAIEPSGKIELAPNEVPSAGYAPGARVIVVPNQGRA
jgi:hypothetical protein